MMTMNDAWFPEDYEPEYCDACALTGRMVLAEYVSTDFDRLCYSCGREIHASVLYYLTDQDA